MQLAHIASRLYGTPLLIARPKLDVILSVLGNRIDWPEPAAAVPIPMARTAASAPTGIAVIPVYGTLVRRSVGLEAASGLTSYADIAMALDDAVNDPSIAAIVLDVDSPGGEAGGVFDLSLRVRAADAIKPIWAVAADSAFSAAYAIACSASRIYVTQTGGVGSIGVIAMHVDQTVRDAQEGYRFTAITAGDQKNDLSPHQPLDPAASARLQTEVDRLYGLFVDHVAAMRNLESRFVRSTQAGLYFGPEAVAAGLADVQGNLDQALSDLSQFLTVRRSRNATGLSLSHSAPTPKETLMSLETQPPVAEDKVDPPKPPTDVAPVAAPLAEPVESVSVPASPSAPVAPDAATAEAALRQVSAQAGVQASQLARADALAIAELCQLAGQPQRIVGFLASGADSQQVRKALLEGRAQSPEISSVIHPDAAAKATSPDPSPLMAAVKKLTAKD
jgi:signal peptide peptidase SppA